MPYAIDLFCGAGGMSEGLIQAGFHILFSSDINEQVKLTYENRHKQLGLIHGYNTFYKQADIRNLTGEFILNSIKNLEIFKNNNHNIPIDVIFGGPPCQGFSLAGKREVDDPRNILFKEYLRIINDIRPKYVVMENVEGFMTTSLKNFIGLKNNKYRGIQLITDILLNEFKDIGYKVLKPTLLDASNFGVPQRRNRAIFIAYLPGYPKPEYPKPLFLEYEKITILDAIGDLISDPVKLKKYNPILSPYQIESKYGRTLKIDKSLIQYNNDTYNYDFSKHEKHITERFSLYKIGEDTSTLRKRIQNKGISLKNKPNLIKLLIQKCDYKYNQDDIIKIFRDHKSTDDMINVLLTKKNNRIKLDYNKLSPTVLTLPDDFISPFEDRILTVREMARLQSFDDSFIFLGKRTTGGNRRKFEVPQYTQVGNAVPPLLAKAIANKIMDSLKKI